MKNALANRHQGFSLVELMITVAIVAILAAIAVPSYQDYVERTRRADAQGALMGLANALERYHTQNGTYTGAAAGGNDTGAPTIYPDESPVEGTPKVYDLTIEAAGDATFTIQAAPKGPQAGDGVMTLNHTGRRGWDENGDGDTDDAGEGGWE